MHRVLFLMVAAGCWSLTAGPAVVRAQPPVAYDADKTLLEVDLVLPVGPGNPLLAQKWRQEFEKIQEPVRIRSFVAEDKPAVTEKPRGPFRVVKVVGLIDLDGKLTFPDRSFQPGQSAALKTWLNEIKTYGAQGSPAGQPRWGLSDDQYETLLKQLSTPTTEKLLGLTLEAALATLPLPEALAIMEHSTVSPQWKTTQAAPVDDETQGLSIGTTLAYLLSQQGLGFRPVRLPGGQIQLLIQPLADIPDAWPVGWPTDGQRPRAELVPTLFDLFETGVQDAPLQNVLDAIEERSGVRLLLDRRACLAKELDPRKIRVSYPKKRTAWALIISSVVVNAHMTMNYRQDEAGTGFLWIAPLAHYVPPGAKK